MMKKLFSLILALALSLACVSALAEGAFPVEIQHAYGTTVIEAEPERVATLFDSNPDPVLALGVVPVGVSSIGYGVVDENGLPAWTNAAFTALDAEANVYDDTDGIAWEQVSDSEPDLILLPNSGITQEDYDRLSEIAPTVPYKEIAYATTWREEVEVTAKALGKDAEGAQLIADTEALIAEKLAEHPELEGKTAAFCWIDVSDLSVVYVYMPLDPRAAFLEDLGLSIPESISALAGPGAFSADISIENIDVLNDIDIIICYGEPEMVAEMQANEILSTVPAVKNGAVVTISAESDLYLGTYVTVLSIPATIDEYVGLLGDAAAKADAGANEGETADAFPMVMQHAFGEITLEEKPERIVTIAWENDCTPLALGIAPVGISADNYGPVSENNIHPWAEEAFQALGVTPNVFSDLDGLDYEAISDADPDVILAAYSGMTQEEYDRLSEIAPVLAYAEKPWQCNWREQTILNAQAMGMRAQGEKLVEEADALIAEKMAAHPELAGIKTAFCWIDASDLSTFYVYLPTDPRAAYLNDLGLVLPDSVLALADDAEAFSVTLSRENADQLSDVQMIVCYGSPDMLELMQADELMASIPAVRDGAVAFIEESMDLAGGATPSILSIPYNIDSYIALLSEAAAKIQ